MPTPYIHGSARPVFKTEKWSFDPSRGLSITREYESGGNNLNGFANELMTDGIAFDMTRSNVRSTITTKTGGASGGVEEIAPDNWQLLGNEIQNSLIDHPDLHVALPYPILWTKIPAFSTSETGEEDLVRWMNDYQVGNPLANLFPAAGTDPNNYPAIYNEALIWFRLYCSGKTAYALGQYVLRHTVTVPGNPYSLRQASAISAFVSSGIERVYTTSQLLSECDATTVTYAIPVTVRSAILSIPVPAFYSGYLWGWRKLPVTMTSAAYNKVDISSEYCLFHWNVSRMYATA